MLLFSSQNQKTEDESEQAAAYIKCPKGKKKRKWNFERENTRNKKVTIASSIKMEKLQKILY